MPGSATPMEIRVAELLGEELVGVPTVADLDVHQSRYPTR